MNNKYDNGFTLVELMVVIVIIGILASLSLMNLRGFQNSSALEQSANELKFTIAQSSLLALRQNQSYTVKFGRPDNYRYQVWTMSGGVPTAVDSFKLKTGVTFTTPADCVVISNSGAVLYIPDSVKIVKEGRTKTITILVSTGEVVIQ